MPKELTEHLSQQLAELQSQFAFQEDSIQQLSDALYSQQQRMDAMEQQIAHLKSELEKARGGEPSRLAEIEVPPHY